MMFLGCDYGESHHEYWLFADDILVVTLYHLPDFNDFLFVSRVWHIPLDRIYAKYIGYKYFPCKFSFVSDLPF